jgi:integrase
MSVRKRKWKTSRGEEKEGWVVDYVDQSGKRHIQTFARKKEADDYHATVKVHVRQGIHAPHSKSIPVAEAAENWIAYAQGEKLEASTLAQYRQHVKYHINPRIGDEKLSRLTTPLIHKFRDDMLAAGTSRALARKVLVSLKSVLRDAQRRGNVAQNVAHGVTIRQSKRDRKQLEVGVDIPTPDEISRILNAATGKRRPFLLTMIFTGLRASELRGLRWQDVNLEASELTVRQRVDRYGKIGGLKSKASKRTVPFGPLVRNALREWKLASPKGELGLVFPTSKGKPQRLDGITRRIVQPVQVAAGVVDNNGKAKYTGAHAFRHFYASYCINRKADSGLELPIKMVQKRMGHASIIVTSDVRSPVR